MPGFNKKKAGDDDVVTLQDIESSRAVELLRRGEFSKISHGDVLEIFQILDINTDGDLSIEEIDDLLEKILPDEDMQTYVKQMLAAGDKDGNGIITISEFHQALKLGSANEVEDLLKVMRGEKDTDGCSGHDLKIYLKGRIQTNENCMSLPFYIIFFGLIWILTVVHLQVYYTHRQNLALRTALLTSTKVSVNWWKSSDELWDWADTFIIPATFGSDPKGRITTNNQVIGGLLLERQDAETIECLPSRLEVLYGDGPVATCYGDLKEDKVAHWFPLEDSLAEHHTELQKLRTSQWLHNGTRSAFASLITYNGQNGFLTHTRLSFAVEDGGSWLLKDEIESFKADPYDPDAVEYGSLIFLDVAFICMASCILVFEVKNLIELKRKSAVLGFKTAFLEHYAEFWKIIDWVNIIQSYACVLHWTYDVAKTLSVVEDLLALPKPGKPGYGNAPTELFERSYQAGFSYKNLRWYVTVFTVTSMLRFFKAFRANARLNIVTRTIIIAAKDLAHFAVVFLSIFFAFVLMGHLVFGPRVSQFSRLATACDSCVMMLVGFLLDDIRGDMLKNTGSTGVAWIYAYIVIMQLLLVNMILVVIFDVYAEVKGAVHNAPTLYEQAMEIARQKRNQIQRIKRAKAALNTRVSALQRGASRGSLDKIVNEELERGSKSPQTPNSTGASWKSATAEELEKMTKELSDSKILSLLLEHEQADGWNPDSLSEQLEGLSRSQAKDLVYHAQKFVKAETGETGLSLYDAVRLIARVDANVQEIMRHWQEAQTNKQEQEDLSNKYKKVMQQARQSWGGGLKNGAIVEEINDDNDMIVTSLPGVTASMQTNHDLPPVPPQTNYHGFRMGRIVE